jgi:hypothetical protein
MKKILLVALIITSCNYQKRKEVIKKCVITDIEVMVASTIEPDPFYNLSTDCGDNIKLRRNIYKIGDTITTRTYYYQKND